MKKLIFILTLASLTACSGNKQPQAQQTADSTAASADTTAATAGASTAESADTAASEVDATTSATSKANEVLFHGTIVLPPQKQASVSLLMDGVVKSTSLIPGQYVGRGAVLATVVNEEFIALQQTYLDSHAQVEYLKTEYLRQQSLSSQQAASEKKFQQSRAEYLSMKSKLQATGVQLRLLGLNPATLLAKGIQPYMIVRAPISGYVSNVTVNLGKYMHTGDALCEIIDKTAPMLKLTTYEKDIVKMRVGSAVEFRVNSMPGKTFRAVVVSIGQNVDQVNRSLDVYARIISRNVLFRPGMYVSVRMEQ